MTELCFGDRLKWNEKQLWKCLLKNLKQIFFAVRKPERWRVVEECHVMACKLSCWDELALFQALFQEIKTNIMVPFFLVPILVCCHCCLPCVCSSDLHIKVKWIGQVYIPLAEFVMVSCIYNMIIMAYIAIVKWMCIVCYKINTVGFYPLHLTFQSYHICASTTHYFLFFGGGTDRQTVCRTGWTVNFLPLEATTETWL